MLFSSQHDDCEDELGGKERFNKKALNDTCFTPESCRNLELTREENIDDAGGGGGSEDLGDGNKQATNPTY